MIPVCAINFQIYVGEVAVVAKEKVTFPSAHPGGPDCRSESWFSLVAGHRQGLGGWMVAMLDSQELSQKLCSFADEEIKVHLSLSSD